METFDSLIRWYGRCKTPDDPNKSFLSLFYLILFLDQKYFFFTLALFFYVIVLKPVERTGINIIKVNFCLNEVFSEKPPVYVKKKKKEISYF